MGRRIQGPAAQGIKLRDAIDAVAKKLDPQRVLTARRPKLDGIAAHAKLAAPEFDVVAAVLKVHDPFEELVAGHFQSHADRDHHGFVILLAADAVNARDAGDDHHIATREQRTHRREAQPLDLLVAARILFDERVRARHVGLGLVIIEVTDKIFHRVPGEKALELRIELGGQSLVVRDDQRRFVDVPDDIGDRKRLSRTGDPEQCLVFRAGQDSFRQLHNRLRLVAGGLIWSQKLEHRARR